MQVEKTIGCQESWHFNVSVQPSGMSGVIYACIRISPLHFLWAELLPCFLFNEFSEIDISLQPDRPFEPSSDLWFAHHLCRGNADIELKFIDV